MDRSQGIYVFNGQFLIVYLAITVVIWLSVQVPLGWGGTIPTHNGNLWVASYKHKPFGLELPGHGKYVFFSTWDGTLVVVNTDPETQKPYVVVAGVSGLRTPGDIPDKAMSIVKDRAPGVTLERVESKLAAKIGLEVYLWAESSERASELLREVKFGVIQMPKNDKIAGVLRDTRPTKKMEQKLLNTLGYKQALRIKKGTRSKVFESEGKIIKINKDLTSLTGELLVLDKIDHPKIPVTRGLSLIGDHGLLVQNKLPGEPLDDVWKQLSEDERTGIVGEIVSLVGEYWPLDSDSFWSAAFNRKFQSYPDFLLYRQEKKERAIKNNPRAVQMFKKVEQFVDKSRIQKVFGDVTPCLVHGDLIIHNFLVEDGRLSGLVDWEFAQFGDPFYDIARVKYYQESAKVCQRTGKNDVFEYEFTTMLLAELTKIIPFDEEKYRIIRSILFVNGLAWALGTEKVEENLASLGEPNFRTK